MHTHQMTDLLNEWEIIKDDQENNSVENFLYYLLKKVQQTPGCEQWAEEQNDILEHLNISQIPSTHSF